MTTVTFTSVPSGAEVELDGEYVGITPCDVEIGEPTTDFHTMCLSNGRVVCDWNTLRPYLENHTVSNLWWRLTETERRSIAEKAVKNTICRLIRYYRMGIDGVWKMLASPCTYNVIIRFQKFGSPVGWADCYWKYTETSTDIHNYVPDHSFGLPCVLVNTYHHVMCGIQVVNSIDSLDNWVVFQYGSFDIKPGHQQMPRGSHVIIQDPFPYTGLGYKCISFDSHVITDFNI